ncbi:MAG: YbjQ family protein [Candidatus Cloacimonetes bacterium]|nr:YbjQ family protein [Candidatus Cloacimonadota bacterium]
MILSTTPSLDGYEISDYLDVVSGEVIMGANIIRDLMASITDVVGGRSGAYESKLQDGRRDAMLEMKQAAMRLGANAILGIDIDYEVIGNSMLMVAVSGTAVVAKKKS